MLYAWIAAAVVLLFLMLFASGCKTIQPVVETHEIYVHDTTQLVDSIYQDRYHTVYTKGDTIYKIDSVWLYKYKFIERNVDVYVHDSVPYPVELYKEVNIRSGYDKFCSCAFWIIVVLLLLRVAWWAFKKFYLHQ